LRAFELDRFMYEDAISAKKANPGAFDEEVEPEPEQKL
jgi:hypothetical protein